MKLEVARGIAEFAADAPQAPGVYFYLGEQADLLYVGKAGNLKKRLQQHALVKPNEEGWISGRYKQVREVRWRELPSEDAAATFEADLIVALQLPFNSNGNRGCWAYINVRPVDGEKLHFGLSVEPGEKGTRVYGCFPHLGKGVSLRPAVACSDGYTALLRLLWAASGEGRHIPTRITRSAPNSFEVQVSPSLRASLHALLSGTSPRLIRELAQQSTEHDRYMQVGLARDQKLARGFYKYGPKALRSLRLRHSRRGLLTREMIEDSLTAELREAIGDFHRLRARS